MCRLLGSQSQSQISAIKCPTELISPLSPSSSPLIFMSAIEQYHSFKRAKMFASHIMLVIQLGPRQIKSAPNAFENLFSSSLLLVLILCLQLAVSLQIGILGQETGNSGTTHSSACDLLLLSASTNHFGSSLTNYCQCKDAETTIGQFGSLSDSKVAPSISQAAATTTTAPTLPSLTRISQLNCSPANLTQLIKDLRTTMLIPSNASFNGKFQIDYLSVDTNIINLQANTNINHLDDLSSSVSLENQLFVDYISLQLGLFDLQTNSGEERVYRNDNESQENDYGEEETNTPDQSAQYLASVEQQMIDFGRLVNELHLQSLSVRFISPNDVEEKEGLARVTEGKEATMVESSNFKPPKKQSTIGRYEKQQRRKQQQHSSLKLDRFLARYSNLIKLELSSNKHRSALEPVLLITSNTFEHQKQLKWLNLASNGKLKIEPLIKEAKVEKEFKGETKNSFDVNYFSPFAASNNLEHLNLEWNGIENFPIFSMLSVPSSLTKQVNSSKQSHRLNSNQNCKALASLTSLNLAGNKLSSFEDDLFTSFEVKKKEGSSFKNGVNTCFYETGTILNGNKHHYNGLNCPSKTFLLPSLSQLDLSYNKLTGFSPKVGQYLLCTMPNLSQLYLQHNKIFHVNLNSLLSFPAIWPDSTHDLSASGTNLFRKSSKLLPAADTPPTIFSRLEHIDLSYNCLFMIIASTSPQHHNNTTSSSKVITTLNPVRLKSIDLSNNNLKKPLISYDIDLIDHIIFEESFSDPFSTKKNSNIFEITNNFANLEQNFLLVANNSPSTICDFLSPPSIKLQDNVDLLNEVILTSNDLNIISKEDFLSQQCKDIQILRLSRNRISIIENEALFPLLNLEHLDLSHNSLNSLLENTFQENTKLRVLNLSHNKFKLLHKNTFSQLLNLEELLLNSNELFAFSNDLIANNQQLITLNLFENKISHLDQSLFANLKQLRFLNLHSNLLKYISQHLFQLTENNSSLVSRNGKYHVNQVVQKRINHNKNSQTNSKNLKKFNNLKSKKASTKKRRQVIEDPSNLLILTSNQIELFEFENCSNFGENIQILWLDNNSLNELKKSSFNCLIKLQRINLRSNRLKNIDGQAFSQLTKLEYIDLSNNELKQIQPGTFGFSIGLRHIDLSSNQLRDINFLDSFGSKNDQNQHAQLDTLKVSENADLKIDISDFCNFLDTFSPKQVHVGHIGQIIGGVNKQNGLLKLTNKLSIEIMNMSFIHQIDDQLYNILGDPNIIVEKLDLSSMNITPSNSFKLITVLLVRLKNELLELNISGNNHINEQILRLFSEITFQTQLNSLDLSSNRLEVWPFDKKVANMLTNLRSLNISKNKLRHFIKINSAGYNFTQLEILNLSSNALVGLVENPTIEIKSLRSVMPNLIQVDLSNNRLAWIPVDFFSDLKDLTWLKLDNNHLETLSAIFASSRFVLDLSFNTKLKSIASSSTHNANTTNIELDNVLEEELDDLILFDDHSSSLPQVVCSSIHEFKFSYESQQNLHLVTTEPDMVGESSLFQDNDDKARANDERCNDIIKVIYSIKLESISPNLNVNSINIDGRYKYLHLNLRKNNLNQIVTNNEGNKDIIQLDISDNRIHKIPNTLCSDLPKLRSLDLNNNFLKECPYEIVSSCLKLGYLDLSFNKITSLNGVDYTKMIANSALMVLKLQHNPIAYLNAAHDIKSFKSLRFIDLRFNQLKYNQLLPLLRDSQSLLTVISDYKVPPQELNQAKPQIKVTNTSLFVDWHSKKINNNKNMIGWRVLDDLQRSNKTQQTPIKYLETYSPIRLCTLNGDNWTEICANLSGDNQYKPGQNCLLIKRPKNLPSCYIQLTESLVVSDKKNSSTADSSHLISFKTDHNNSHLESKVDDDFVLTLIDSMKRNWLRFKELDLNTYLSSISNIKGDSVWIQIDGKYPLYTLTIVKIAIVGGSLSIIGLLIAMFILLTYLSTTNDNNKNHHASPRSSSELTNITSEIDTSGSSTINKLSTISTSQINTQSSLQQSNQACSMNTTNSGSTSKEDTQLQTVLERTKSQKQQQYQSLDAGQLFQQQQACSTPSSSLAPSSVETAETLQAIDSIQSGSSAIPQYNIVNKDCVDQYSDLSRTNIYNNNHLNNQVATVMRIVKSNSANFDTSNRQIAGDHNKSSQYGTANSRFLNQSTLRSKIRNLQEHHQHKHQVYPSFTLQGVPTGYYSSQVDQFAYDYNIPQQINHQFEATGGGRMGIGIGKANEVVEHENNSTLAYESNDQQDLDPTTMSLLSINTAISNSFRSSTSQQVSPAESKSISIGINDQQSNLCSYHRLARDQSTANNEQLGQAANVILEQEEEQYPGSNLVLVGTLPPPPPSRAIEELENNIVQYLPSSSNQSSNFYHN